MDFAIHELWDTLQRGPGASKEGNALRNAIVPKDAGYGHLIKVDHNGSLMNRINILFETKQEKVQMKGISKCEMLRKHFHGNEQAMQQAIKEKDISVKNGLYYWGREIYEHITGGKSSYSSGPQPLDQQDLQKMMEIL